MSTLFTRRNAIIAWALCLVWFIALLVYPPSTGFTRMTSVILSGLIYFGLLGLGWAYHYFRWSLVAIFAAVAVFMVLPGSTEYDRLALRQETVSALARYEGARYHWGGENR